MRALDIQITMTPSPRSNSLALAGCLFVIGACANSEPGTTTPGSAGSSTPGTAGTTGAGGSNTGVAGTVGSGGTNPAGGGGTTGGSNPAGGGGTTRRERTPPAAAAPPAAPAPPRARRLQRRQRRQRRQAAAIERARRQRRLYRGARRRGRRRNGARRQRRNGHRRQRRLGHHQPHAARLRPGRLGRREPRPAREPRQLRHPRRRLPCGGHRRGRQVRAAHQRGARPPLHRKRRGLRALPQLREHLRDQAGEHGRDLRVEQRSVAAAAIRAGSRTAPRRWSTPPTTRCRPASASTGAPSCSTAPAGGTRAARSMYWSGGNADAPGAALHEGGHGFHNLSDEYGDCTGAELRLEHQRIGDHRAGVRRGQLLRQPDDHRRQVGQVDRLQPDRRVRHARDLARAAATSALASTARPRTR